MAGGLGHSAAMISSNSAASRSGSLQIRSRNWSSTVRAVVSPVEDFTNGEFREVIDDPRFRDADGPATGVTKLLLCSGKIYWELAAARDKQDITDTAIVRIEQLYPMPKRTLAALLERYPNAADVRWVQEEPANQGAWPYLGLELPDRLPERLSGLKRVSRRRMAPPAAGSSQVFPLAPPWTPTTPMAGCRGRCAIVTPRRTS